MNQSRRLPVSVTKALPLLLISALCFGSFVSPANAAPRFKESRLDRSKADVREPLYTEWMDPFKVGAFVAASEGFPIYQEISRKRESRVLLVSGLKRARYYFYCLMSEESLIQKQLEFTAQGYTLITLSEDADGRYAATWVDTKSVDVYKKKLDELGISPATVKD